MKWSLRLCGVFALIIVALLTLARRDFSGAWTAYSTGYEPDPRIFLNAGVSMQSTSQNHVSSLEVQVSPDGEWIAFLVGHDRAHLHVYRARPDGSVLQRLSANPGRRFDLKWFEDNEWLHYSEEFGESYRVDDRRLPAFGPVLDARYRPTAATDWHPLLMTLAALGIVAVSLLWKRRR